MHELLELSKYAIKKASKVILKYYIKYVENSFKNFHGMWSIVIFDNHKRGSTILWDDMSLRKHDSNTDAIIDPIDYSLYVKNQLLFHKISFVVALFNKKL